MYQKYSYLPKLAHIPSEQSGGFAHDDFLGRSEFEFFIKMVNHIGDELMLINHAGQIVFVNDATVQAFARPREEILNHLVTDFFTKRTSVKSWRETHFKELKAKRQPISYQIERTIKNGERQTIEVTAVFMEYSGNEFVLSVGRDVTKQNAMQAALTEMVDFYHLLSEEAGDPILIVDGHGKLTYANQSAEDVLQSPGRALIGSLLLDFVCPDYRVEMKKNFARALKSPSRFTAEADFFDTKGERVPLELTFSSIVKDGTIVAFHIIGHDLRPRHQLEQLTLESEKMKAVQYFVSGAAQELRNPLMGVLKSTQSLMDKYHDRDFEYIGFKEFKDIMQILENVNKQIKYCYDTTAQLETLSTSKMKIGANHCSVVAVVKELLKLRKAQFVDADIVINNRISSQLPEVAMSAIDLNQVLTSLLDNAVEAMPGGGAITIRALKSQKSGMVQIEVKDEGVGIPPEILPHVFEPFYTTKQRGVERNTGLGLPIAHSLVTACGGEIKVLSSQTKGASVKIVLPIKKS